MLPTALNPAALGAFDSFLEDTTPERTVRGVAGILHGPPGSGKTSILCQAPHVVVIPDPYSDNTGAEVHKLTGTIPKSVRIVRPPQTWPELLFCIDELAAKDHPFQNILLDNMTGFQQLLFTYTREQAKLTDDKEFYAYSRGPKIAGQRYAAELTTHLNNLLNKGINVWLICHTRVGQRPNPAGVEAQAYGPSFEKDVWECFKAWAELVLFLAFDFSTEKQGMREKTRVTGRSIFTQDQGWCEAKSWLSLQPMICLPDTPQESWPKIEQALQKVGRLQPPAPAKSKPKRSGPKPTTVS